MIDYEKFPECRPDHTKFWLLRLLAWLLLFAGLAAVAYGGLTGTLAYYGSKNGHELTRFLPALAGSLIAVVGGLLTMAVGQVFRVIMAIEENTRLIAFHTRPRPRPPEPPRRPAPAPMREHIQA